MANKIQTIKLKKLIAHPENANRMSKTDFNKLVRNIERTGRYEPIVVRPHPQRAGDFQIINGHHRCKALQKLGYESSDCVIWKVGDEETRLLLATLNRLQGKDKLDKKVALLRHLKERMEPKQLSRLLPQTAKQIERLTLLKRPRKLPKQVQDFARPMVFFLDAGQRETVTKALSMSDVDGGIRTAAAKRSAALAGVCRDYIESKKEV